MCDETDEEFDWMKDMEEKSMAAIGTQANIVTLPASFDEFVPNI